MCKIILTVRIKDILGQVVSSLHVWNTSVVPVNITHQQMHQSYIMY